MTSLSVIRVVNCVGPRGVGIRPELADDPFNFYRSTYDNTAEKGCDEVEFAWAFGRQNFGLRNPLRAGQGRFYHKDQKPLREAMWTFLDWLHLHRPGHVPVRVGLGFPPKRWITPCPYVAFDDVSGRPALFLDRTHGYDVIGESVPVDNVRNPALATRFVLPKGYERVVWRVKARVVKRWLERSDSPIRTALIFPNVNVLFTGDRDKNGDPADDMPRADLDRRRPLLHGVTLMNAPAEVERWAAENLTQGTEVVGS